MIGEPLLDCVWQEPRHGQLHESMEQPEHQQSEWKRQDKSTGQSVAESAIGSEAEKILEIRCEGAYYQTGGHEVEAPKRESSGTVC